MGLKAQKRALLERPDLIMWWSWRELNPRPQYLHPRSYMLSQSFS